MKEKKESNYKLKNAVNKLLFSRKEKEAPSRNELNHQIKNIILTNKQLNHRCMNFNFEKEYKSMHKTMTKFNNEQNSKKDLILKLSKENQIFTESYSNVIASLAGKLDKKSINYHTISNFKQKYEPSLALSNKNNNLFYEDPLLLTKSKDLDFFYLNDNNVDSNKDQSLNYSKKLLYEINHNSPLNRVFKIIEKRTSKIYNEEIFKNINNINNLSERNNNINLINQIINENQPLSDRPSNYFRNDNLFYDKYTTTNDINEKNEIKLLKKYNRKIKKLLDKNKHERTYSEKNLNIFGSSSMLNDKKTNDNKNKYNSTDTNKNKNIKLNLMFSSKNLRNNIPKKLQNIKPIKKKSIILNEEIMNEINKKILLQEKTRKSFKKKLGRMRKLKGSIQIQSIYKDVVKTKETINQYEKEKNQKFKYLYTIFNKKKNPPFQKEEKENKKINKLDHDLFWTVNKFHNN